MTVTGRVPRRCSDAGCTLKYCNLSPTGSRSNSGFLALHSALCQFSVRLGQPASFVVTRARLLPALGLAATRCRDQQTSYWVH